MGDDALTRRALARVHRTVEGWRLGRFVGFDRVVATYEATHEGRGTGAMRILPSELSSDLGARASFYRETEMAGRVEYL